MLADDKTGISSVQAWKMIVLSSPTEKLHVSFDLKKFERYFIFQISRNSAVGTSSTMAHVGSIAAPYVVDLLGSKAWWAPSTLCGVAAVIAGLLSLGLPETRGRPLTDTVAEEVAPGRGRVSIKNCCSCR